MLSQLSMLSLDKFGVTAAWLLAVGGTVIVLLFVVLSAMIWRFQRRFIQRWESVDKRLSEVLWRTRRSDAEELRKRTAVLEEQLVDMLRYLQTVANTIDAQMEGLSNEMKNSLSKLDRADSKSVGASRMVIYQLERIRKQLNMLQEAASIPPSAVGSSSQTTPGMRTGGVGQAGAGYRVEAVFEPIKQKIREAEKSNTELEQLLDELSWEKKS